MFVRQVYQVVFSNISWTYPIIAFPEAAETKEVAETTPQEEKKEEAQEAKEESKEEAAKEEGEKEEEKKEEEAPKGERLKRITLNQMTHVGLHMPYCRCFKWRFELLINCQLSYKKQTRTDYECVHMCT